MTSRLILAGSTALQHRAAGAGTVQTRGVTVDATTGFNRGFTLAEMTGVINRDPPVPSAIGARLPWTPRGVTQRVVKMEDYGRGFEVVPPKGWDSNDPKRRSKPKRSLMPLEVYHHPLADTLRASEIQGRRALGSEVTPETVEAARDDIVVRQRRDHEVTWEHDRALALRGLVPNPNGEYDDLYEMLKSRKTTHAINLAAAGLQIRQEFTKIKRKVEKVLGQMYPIRGWQAIAGSDAFDAITGHESFVKIVERQAEGGTLREDLRNGYTFMGNVTLSSYDLADYVPADKILFCPIIDDFYFSFFAPMDHFDTVNRMGLPMYANSWIHPNGKSMEIESESNALHVVAVPEAIVEVTVG